MSIFSKFWLSVRTVWDYTIDGVFSVFCCCWQKHIPPVSNPIVLESATTLAEKIRNQQLKVESVVTAFIERINEVNGVLNAIVANRFDEALKEARQIDRDIEDGKITAKEFSEKPLLGIPFTTKESTSCKGFPHTLGLKCRKDIIACQDAPAVTRMKNAGAILIGVTNIPELIWQESFNTVYGRTNNPYSTTRTAGGSSGGEACNVSACGCPVGIGTDLGGSIRIPCFMCGVFGHKISAGLATTKGTYFQEDDDPDTMGTVGPITKFAADLAPVVKVLVGEHISKLSLDIEVNVREIQIYYNLDSSPTYSPLRKEIKELHKRVISHFNDISSCKPEKIDCDDIEYGAKLWQYWLTQEQNTDFKRDLKNRKGKASTFKEVLKFLTCLSEHSMSTPTVLVGELLPQAKEDWARDVTQQMREELIDKLGTNGVLLYPSAPFPASYHYTAFFRPFNFGYFGIWNVLKLPVTQVPLGLSKEGLPLGIQVVAGPCQDHLCIAVAKELENAFGGYVPPFEL